MLELVERRRESTPQPSPLDGGTPSGSATTGRRSGMSTEARGLQPQPAPDLGDGLSRQVVVRLLVVLAAAAGGVDVMAVSRLGGPFASVVTGNLIQLGRSLAIPNRQLAASPLTAVASYALRVAIGTAMLRGSLPGWRFRTCVVASLELLLLVGVLLGWLITAGAPRT